MIADAPGTALGLTSTCAPRDFGIGFTQELNPTQLLLEGLVVHPPCEEREESGDSELSGAPCILLERGKETGVRSNRDFPRRLEGRRGSSGGREEAMAPR